MSIFLYNKIPMLKSQYSYDILEKMSDKIFFRLDMFQHQHVFNDGDRNDVMYVIKRGECGLYKDITYKDHHGRTVRDFAKIMTLGEGDVLGEEVLIFNRPCSYTIIVETESVYFFRCQIKEFHKKFKRLIPHFKKVMVRRYQQYEMEIGRYIQGKKLIMPKPMNLPDHQYEKNFGNSIVHQRNLLYSKITK